MPAKKKTLLESLRESLWILTLLVGVSGFLLNLYVQFHDIQQIVEDIDKKVKKITELDKTLFLMEYRLKDMEKKVHSQSKRLRRRAEAAYRKDFPQSSLSDEKEETEEK